MAKKLFMIADHCSGSSCSAVSIDPLTSTKSTVTSLRSPSRAAREASILSARLFVTRVGDGGAAAAESGVAHLRQNLAPGRLPAPQAGHADSNGAPHSSQNAA